jgi:hypothetical protein
MTALKKLKKPPFRRSALAKLLFPTTPKQSRQLIIGAFIALFLSLLILRRYLTFPLDVERQLKTLRPVFQVKVRVWLALVKTRLGLDVLITSATRSFAQQSAQHRADPRNPAPDLNNPDVHMSGIAVDVNFLRNGKPVLLKATPSADWAPVVALAHACKIARWGGNFSNYPDRVHFDDRV